MVEEQFTCPLTRGERILVAVDGSKYSEMALEQALSMAKVCNSRLFAIGVTDVPSRFLGELEPRLKEKLANETRQILDQVRKRIEQENISFEIIERMGSQPHELIVQEAKDREIDLVILGTHGRTGLSKLIMGSVTQGVIGNAPCPVMVVPLRE